MFSRPPDFVIGGKDNPYLERWVLLPRNRWLNIYVHQFLRSDDDRALHDHPWRYNISILLRGTYNEVTHVDGQEVRQLLTAPAFKLRIGPAPHRVELIAGADGKLKRVWTLFIVGKRVREWGFLCPAGWRHWREFTSPHDKGQVGRGCE